MCGIVGYAGAQQATTILLEVLHKLEYRGYDSAGICVSSPDGLTVVKTKGDIRALEMKLSKSRLLPGTVGIGHTRWATHGVPSDANSHPHTSCGGKISLVHNGIIENEAELRRWLQDKGMKFSSQTDSEVIVNLIGYYYSCGDTILASIRHTVQQLKGSFGLCVLCADFPDTVFAVKKESPLIFGLGKYENFIASDIQAILKYTRKVTYLNDGEIAVFDAQSVKFCNFAGEPIVKKYEEVAGYVADAQKGEYGHFMLKEIMEQPSAVSKTLTGRIENGYIKLEEIPWDKETIKRMKRIYTVACGSAYYVAMVAKYDIEKYCHIPTEAMMASEFRYAAPVLNENTLVICISQSGETADTLAALKEAKRQRAMTLAIVNVVESAMAKQADHVIYTWAGPEIAVATTKAFSAQLAVVYLLTLYMANLLGTMESTQCERYVQALLDLPQKIETVLKQEILQKCEEVARRYGNRNDAFYVGRNVDSAICLEGSLKLKEIAYLHSEAYPAGELKHGPISMIEEGTLVVAVNTVDTLFDKTIANLKEVKARGAQVLCIAVDEMKEQIMAVADDCICVPQTLPLLQTSLNVIPLQLFAYHMALNRGCNVDKPRNLAKSVTVE